MAGGRWHVAQLSGGWKKGWHYVSPTAGSGGKKRDGAEAGAGGVLSTFYVLMFLVLII